jgi:hypothetical protein
MEYKEETPLGEVEQRLRLIVSLFKVSVMERVKEATEKGDLEAASRWLNILNTARNLLGKKFED